jgi:hypothetical protein
MPNLIEIDKEFNMALSQTFHELKSVYEKVITDYKFDLNKTEITEAILLRLKTYYSTQNDIKTLLDKRYIAAAADFFVESTLFFLKTYFKKQGDILQAHSERQVKQTRNSIRPDISVWKGDEVVAIIECKTQLGWSRNNWEHEFLERDKKLKSDYPNAKSFLLVMTGLNWSGFGNNSKLDDSYFCLLNDIWPSAYSDKNQIFTPIEGLVKQLK